MSDMQTQTLDKTTVKITPYNEVAELIDREIHQKTLEQINILAREYEIRNPSKVAEFLGENLFLLDLLKEIPHKLSKFFGRSVKLAVELVAEPEMPSSKEIFVIVLTKKDAKEARAKMDEFDQKWWLENIDKANCKLNVSLEYV